MVPNLYLKIDHQSFRLGDSFVIVTANHFVATYKVAIAADGIYSIFQRLTGRFGGLGGGDIDD